MHETLASIPWNWVVAAVVAYFWFSWGLWPFDGMRNKAIEDTGPAEPRDRPTV